MSQSSIILPTTGAVSGLAMTQNINAGLDTLASLFSGPAAPSTTIAYQLWADTTTGLLKQRNAANTAWIALLTLVGITGADIRNVPAGIISATNVQAALNELDTKKTSVQMMHIRDEKAVGTSGGTSIVGENTRTLNTVVRNTITGASLAANVVTLPAGTFRVRGRAPCHRGTRHKAYLYNTSAAALSIAGSNQYADSTTSSSSDSTIIGVVTLASAANFELRQSIATALATNGLGLEMNVAASGIEVYSELWIDKEV